MRPRSSAAWILVVGCALVAHPAAANGRVFPTPGRPAGASSVDHVALLTRGDRVVVTVAPDARARGGVFVVPLPFGARGVRGVSAEPLDRLEEATRPELVEATLVCSVAPICDTSARLAELRRQPRVEQPRPPISVTFLPSPGCESGLPPPAPSKATPWPQVAYAPPVAVAGVVVGTAEDAAYVLAARGAGAMLPRLSSGHAASFAYVVAPATTRLPAIQYEAPMGTLLPGFEDPAAVRVVSVLTTDADATLEQDDGGLEELMGLPAGTRASEAESVCASSGACARVVAETDTSLRRAGSGDDVPRTLGADRLGAFDANGCPLDAFLGRHAGDATRLDARVRRFRLRADTPLRLVKGSVAPSSRAFVTLDRAPPGGCERACFEVKRGAPISPGEPPIGEPIRMSRPSRLSLRELDAPTSLGAARTTGAVSPTPERDSRALFAVLCAAISALALARRPTSSTSARDEVASARARDDVR